MKNKLKKIKEIWNNKRYRAVIILIMYIIFFALSFVYLDSFKTKNNTKNTNYYYIINNEITVKDLKITYKDNIYSKKDFSEYNFNLTLDDINNLIKNGTLESQNYIENTLTYIVNVEEYNKLLDNKLDTNETIKIIVYKEDNKINVDFSLVYGYPYVVDYIIEGR